jgi:hypothetical protein
VKTAGIFLLLLLHADGALAWGLQTHLYLAQQALSSAPPAQPWLVLAGACLPDLSLAGQVLGTPAFRRAHLWSTLRRLAATPRNDAERALAVGYASHLLADVVAHNAFVPEHERRIARVPHFTHALAEWAMDHHVGAQCRVGAREALLCNRPLIAEFVARAFRCGEALAGRAIGLLAGADGALRASPLPRLCRYAVGIFHRDAVARFDAYLAKAAASAGRLDDAVNGLLVDWVASDPEGRAGDEAADRGARQHIARIMQAEHHP